MPAPQSLLIVDDDPSIAEALGAALERSDRRIFIATDLEAAQIVVEREPLSHVITDIRLSGPFAFEGLDFIRHIKRHAPGTCIVLMTGTPSEELRAEAASRGAVAFLAKPFEIAELERIVDGLQGPDLPSQGEGHAPMFLEPLSELLGGGRITAHFQKIVRLDNVDGAPFAYESLARLGTGTIFDNPSLLFDYAQRLSRTAELEVACLRAAISSAARGFPAGTLFFLNIHPISLSSHGRLGPNLIAAAEQASLPLDRIVLEITEQASLDVREGALETIADLHAAGLRFAFDDVGVAYSHLPFIDRIRPEFVKISQDFGTSFESDPTKLKIVRNILNLAREFDCQLILEGIEEQSTADAARALGVPLGQGWLFGRPAAAEPPPLAPLA